MKINRIFLVLIIVSLMVLGGCEVGMSVHGKAFYPKENNDQVWKSRQATVERPSWSFGYGGD